MDKELQQMLASLFGENLLTLSEGQEVSTELALTQIKTLVQQNKDFADAVKAKDEEIENSLRKRPILKKTSILTRRLKRIGIATLNRIVRKRWQHIRKFLVRIR